MTLPKKAHAEVQRPQRLGLLGFTGYIAYLVGAGLKPAPTSGVNPMKS